MKNSTTFFELHILKNLYDILFFLYFYITFQSFLSYKFVEINGSKIDEFWCNLGGCRETFEYLL